MWFTSLTDRRHWAKYFISINHITKWQMNAPKYQKSRTCLMFSCILLFTFSTDLWPSFTALRTSGLANYLYVFSLRSKEVWVMRRLFRKQIAPENYSWQTCEFETFHCFFGVALKTASGLIVFRMEPVKRCRLMNV